MTSSEFHSLTDRIGRVHDADSDEQIGTGRVAADGEAIALDFLPDDDAHPPKEVPDRLVFVDRHGVTGLVGCNLRRSFRKGRLPGWIEVHADHAIDITGTGARDFDRVSNVRSEIAGLAMWATLTPVVTAEHYVDDDDLLKRLVLEAKAGDAKEIGTPDGLRFVPHFSAGSSRSSSGGSHEITERMFVETRIGGEPVPLDDHLKTHRNIQELLVVAYGKPCGQRLSWVSSNAHPKRAPLTGKVVGDKWRHLVRPRRGGCTYGSRAATYAI